MIEMASPCSDTAPNDITVILTVGKNTVEVPAQRERISDPWTGVRRDRLKFPADRAMASLLLKGGRTLVQRSTAARNKAGEVVASFLFDCNQQVVWQIDVSAFKDVDVDYVRLLLPGGVPGRQHFRAGLKPYPIRDVQITGEDLRLQIGSKTREPRDLGLFIVSADDRNWPIFVPHSENPRLAVFNSKFPAKAQDHDGSIHLSRPDVVEAFYIQLFKKNSRNGSNPRDNRDDALREAGLVELILKVKE
jgi:hypothetical protein